MRRIILPLLLATAAALSTTCFLIRPKFRFTNRLAAPVQLTVGEAPSVTVAPGATVTVPVSRGRTMVAEWEMVRPASADHTPMGEEVRGSVVLRDPSGTTEGAADARQGESRFFAPLITNASSEPLRITVNAGLIGPVDCGCAVRPGATRVFVGYYRLYGNSTVRARSKAGEGTFRDLGPQVTNRESTVGLRFEDKDLRPVSPPRAGTGAPPPA
jgi:hypothetical protein